MIMNICHNNSGRVLGMCEHVFISSGSMPGVQDFWVIYWGHYKNLPNSQRGSTICISPSFHESSGCSSSLSVLGIISTFYCSIVIQEWWSRFGFPRGEEKGPWYYLNSLITLRSQWYIGTSKSYPGETPFPQTNLGSWGVPIAMVHS